MKEVATKGHFHIVYVLKYIRYGLLLCLVPMIQAAIRFDLPSLYTALRQDAVILIVMFFVSLAIWQKLGFSFTDKTLTLRYGVILKQTIQVHTDQIAVVELDRSLFLRLVGCTRVKLYAARSASFGSVKFYLRKHHAAMLAERMMPVKNESSFFAPTGAERIRFTMLSANIVTTAALLVFSAKQTQDILGQNLGAELGHLAVSNLEKIEQLAELFLPAGVAWLFTLGFILWGISLFWSLLTTANFRVSRSGGIILSKGGYINHTERRVLASAVSYCDIRITPTSRLLRCYPVYLSAGNYSGADLPILVYSKGRDALLQALMPKFTPPSQVAGLTVNRSMPQFIWKSGSLLLLCAALTAVSVWRLPELTPLLVIPLLLSCGLVVAGIEGWFTEGVRRNKNGTLSIRYTRFFTHHQLCVFTPDLSFSVFQTPFSENVARCNLSIRLPCRRRVRIRSIKRYEADRLKLVI